MIKSELYYSRFHRIYSALIGLILVLLFGVVGFHLYGISQTLAFNEDIWLRNNFTLDQIFVHGEMVHFSPLWNLMWSLNKFLPYWGPASHLQMILLNFLGAWLLLRIFQQTLHLSFWLSCLGVGWFFSMPILTEGTFWFSGLHPFLSLICFLAALLSCPASAGDKSSWRPWIKPALFWLLMLSASPVTYASYFLLISFRLWENRRDPVLVKFWGLFFLLGIIYICLRNWVLNGSAFVFSLPHYGMPSEHHLKWSMEILVEILAYTHPLLTLNLSWPEGYLTYSPRDLVQLLHLLWILPMWCVVWRSANARSRDIALYGLGAALTLMMLRPVIASRYFPPLVFVQITGLLIFWQIMVHALEIIRQSLGMIGGIVILVLNFSAKANGEWHQWIILHQREEAILDVIDQANDKLTPKVFVLNYPDWPAEARTGGAPTTLNGLRLILQDQQKKGCIYLGHREGASAIKIEQVKEDNNPQKYLKPAPPYPCPLQLQPGQLVQCYESDNLPHRVGQLRPLKGLLQVPVREAEPTTVTVSCADSDHVP